MATPLVKSFSTFGRFSSEETRWDEVRVRSQLNDLDDPLWGHRLCLRNSMNFKKLSGIIIKHLWWIIAITGCLLLFCHSFQIKTITVDTISLALLALILLSPFVAAIKRIKIGEFEAEIDPEEVKRVTDEVASKIPEREAPNALTTDDDHSAISAIRELAKTDSVIALAKLRIELERTLRRLHNRSNAGQPIPQNATLHQLIRDLASRDVIPHDLTPAIRDVLALCNRAVHGEAIRDTDAEAVINAGAELLQEFERLVQEYGVAHPIEKATITNSEVQTYQAAQYRVVTIIPYVKSPQRVTYMLTHEELEDFFDGYSDFGEFVVSIERSESKPV